MNPTNEQLKQYLTNWINGLNGIGLVITDDELIKKQIQIASELNFAVLRTLFNQDSEGDN